MTKQDLKQYIWIQRNIEKLEQRIEELHAIATRQTTFPKTDADAIHGTGYQDRQGEVLAELVDLQRELEEQLQKAFQIQLAIEKAIERLPEREKYLIRARYIEGKTWEQIAVDMGYAWAQVHRVHAKALKMLT